MGDRIILPKKIINLNMKQLLDNYYTILGTKLRLTKDVKKYYGRQIAPNFNSFNFWWLDENKVSEILAFFLDPKGSHEQGDVFLQIFLKKLEIDFSYTENDTISVICEKQIENGRRIDILISLNNFEKVIGIENKIYVSTSDQENQIIDYLKFLKKQSNDNYLLLYLRPEGKELAEHSITKSDFEYYTSKQKFKSITYEGQIIECIHEFSKASENERVRAFLKDFEKKLTQMYMGEDNLNENQIVADYIIENTKNLELSFQVYNSLRIVKTQLQEKFQNQILEIGLEFDFKVDELAITPKNWKNHFIYFSYESGGIIYGIMRNKEDKIKPRLPEITELFTEKFNVSPWWPMWQFFYHSIEHNNSFWLDIYNGNAKTRAREFVKTIAQNCDTDKY